MDTINDCFRSLNNQGLVLELMQACVIKGAIVKTAMPNFAIQTDATEQKNKIDHLKSLLLERLDKMAPPFKRGDILMPGCLPGAKPVDDNTFDARYLIIPKGKTETVFQVLYECGEEGGIWLVRFLGRRNLYRATDFLLVNADRVAPRNDAPGQGSISQLTAAASLADGGDGLGRACQKHGMIWCKKIECQ